ncbi:sporulation protein YqfC [Caloramator quimbayensis]|uniref:Sporulation protein YqfC n=1 Tax=Caloramator quimbayensis TaxID=1147123 RepID=A0A1T4X8D0_9CLOT|nr:sporulation protein YqfC [Caloramator quimbayensis]SKA85900.1 sporulation protein YqfC [Caloramator quimbayensis]
MQKNNINNFKSRLSESLDIPKDVSFGVPNIKMTGNIEITIENHKGIIEYSQNILRINSGCGIIKISGKDLEIKEINQEYITIKGIFDGIEFIY